jgi:hypothetical protein
MMFGNREMTKRRRRGERGKERLALQREVQKQLEVP